MAKAFDRKFGQEFLESLPTAPGIYRVFDSEEKLIYVGKAKNLRRRLLQYRNAKRRKKHHKMRVIVRDAARIETLVCGDELEAVLLEARLIQELRPKWNVAGAFSFLYPMIGLRRRAGETQFCFTTSPEECDGFELHGAFRSRFIAGEAFFDWMKLLEYVGHRIPRPSRLPGSRTYVYSFRRIPEEWLSRWGAFLRGESSEAMELLILAMVENAGARKSRKETQQRIDSLVRFWKHEALPLKRVRESVGWAEYPVPQRERDLIFLEHRYGREGLRKIF